MSELKKCPFCGCKNIQFGETDNDTYRFQIVCMQCFNGTDKCISKEIAIERWNARTPMANIVEKLEELPYGRSYHDYAEKGIVHKYLERNDVLDIVKQESEQIDKKF